MMGFSPFEPECHHRRAVSSGTIASNGFDGARGGASLIVPRPRKGNFLNSLHKQECDSDKEKGEKGNKPNELADVNH
jgi:hypothetical protein